jgi:hypothetical protein
MELEQAKRRERTLIALTLAFAVVVAIGTGWLLMRIA